MFYNNPVILSYQDEKICIDESYCRSEVKRKTLAIKILRGRLWMKENGMTRNSEVVFNYDLPDEEPFPHELSLYKKSVK